MTRLAGTRLAGDGESPRAGAGAPLRLVVGPALRGQRWWRCEFAAGGELLSVREVERQELPAGLVVYVRAATEELARHRAQVERNRAATRWRQAAHRELGLCGCGRTPKAGGKKCQFCLDLTRQSRERRLLREQGVEVPRPSKAIAHQARLEELRRKTRLEVLLEVRSAWARLRSDAEFTEWIRVTIARLGGGL